MHGLLMDKDHDETTYYFLAGNARGKTRLHYDDLEKLFVLHPAENNPLPIINGEQNS